MAFDNVGEDDMLTVYIDIDDMLCDYSSKIKKHRQKNPDNPFPQSVPGFFRNLAPIDGALAAVVDCLERAACMAHMRSDNLR